MRFAKLLLLREKELGTKPSEVQLSPVEVALVSSVPGVPVSGCSVHRAMQSHDQESCVSQPPRSTAAAPSTAAEPFQPQGQTHPSDISAEASGSSGVSQPAVQARKRLREESIVTHKDESRVPAKIQSVDDQRVLLLQLKRQHYDAIKSGRKQLEARPLIDGENRGGRQSIFDKLATVGRVAVLQSGAGTNDRVQIAEVRRYTTNPYAGLSAVHDMVVELGSELLPDAADANARVKVHESFYGAARCARGFVAMRLERSNEAPTDTIGKGASDSMVNLTGIPN